MKFSYHWLQDYIEEKLPEPKKLAHLFLKHSFEVNKLIQIQKDWIFDIDIFFNRAFDCFSHIGMAKEIAGFCNLTVKIPAFQFQPNDLFWPKSRFFSSSSISNKELFTIKISDQNLCLRYIGLVMDNVRVDSAPEWMQNRLEACGLKSINNIVDILNYVMIETGQPLHAFDLARVGDTEIKNIIIRRAEDGEKIITLDNKNYQLTKDILVIADQKKPLAIAGIKGGQQAEINQQTRIIIIEAANFNRLFIRQASQRLGLRTDASWRFENGVNINETDYAIKRAASLIKEIANGEVKDYLDISSDVFRQQKEALKLSPKIVELKLDHLKKVLNQDFSTTKVKKILKNLFFEFDENFQRKNLKVEFNNGIFEVEIPYYRQDISIPEDLIEEIGRISNYDNIKEQSPTVLLSAGKEDSSIVWEKFTKELMKQVGFSEVYNYSFVPKDRTSFSSDNNILVQNPVSKHYNYLRSDLIFNFKENIRQNFKNFSNLNKKEMFSKIKLFELGTVFQKKNNTVIETIKLAICLATIFESKKQSHFNQEYILTQLKNELKGVIDYLLTNLNIDLRKVTYSKVKIDQHLIFHFDHSVFLKINKKNLGYFGIAGFDDYLIAYFEFNFEELIKFATFDSHYQKISSYPAATRDLSIFVPIKTNFQTVLAVIQELNEILIQKIELKKVFINVSVENYQKKKNFVLQITYQSPQKTLSSTEIDKIQQKIIAKLEQQSWLVRVS